MAQLVAFTAQLVLAVGKQATVRTRGGQGEQEEDERSNIQECELGVL
jgi:hypothetical protein